MPKTPHTLPIGRLFFSLTEKDLRETLTLIEAIHQDEPDALLRVECVIDLFEQGAAQRQMLRLYIVDNTLPTTKEEQQPLWEKHL